MMRRLIAILLSIFVGNPSFAVWNELNERRARKSKTYQDSENPQKRTLTASIGTIHYESVLDSGQYDTEVNFTPQHVTAGGNDVWMVTNAGWHYALGKPADKATDGWVGFGGRQGAHWFKSRLARVGYLHWPARAWDDIGGAPTYDRANLSNELVANPIGPNGEAVVMASKSTWSNIWTTPGNGQLSIQWSVSGGQLKEEIVINQEAREWIIANRAPATPLNETYFGFVFEVDWSDIPKIIRQGIQKLPSEDYADDGEPIELRDALDRVLAFMPVGNVYAKSVSVPLRKRFYEEGGSHYLLLGVRTDALASMPAGDLVFDPTIDELIDDQADDGFVYSGATANNFKPAENTVTIGYHTNANFAYIDGWWRFDDISGLSGATIDTSYMVLDTVLTGPVAKLLRCDDSASPAAPTDRADFQGRTLTTAGVPWDGTLTADPGNTPSLNTILQEIADSYDPSSIMIVTEDNGQDTGTTVQASFVSFTLDIYANLHIEYTAGGGGGEPSTPATRRIIVVE